MPVPLFDEPCLGPSLHPLNGVSSNVNFRNGRLHLNHKVPVVNTHETHDYCHTEDVAVPM